MAGALTISTLNDSSGVLATQNGMTGIAKAWVNYSGVTNTVRASFNVSSVTDNGTGDFTINFTTAMPNVDYCIVTPQSSKLNSALASVFPNTIAGAAVDQQAPTTSAFRLAIQTLDGTARDSEYVYVAVFSS